MLRWFILAQILVLTTANLVLAERVQSWPYDRLIRESDVVVIASARGTVPSDIRPEGQLAGAKVVAQITAFDVKAAIKGDVGQAIDLLHFRLADGHGGGNGGPLFMHFRTKTLTFEVTHIGDMEAKAKVRQSPPDYLLFLKKTQAGHYEPVTGRYHSRLSAKEVHPPLLLAGDDHE